MSVLNTLPAPIIQMGHVEKLIEVEQNQSHVQQLVAQETAREALRAQGERVSEVETSERGRRVREREAGGNRRQPGGEGQAKREASGEGEEASPDSGSGKPNPWAGHIVNMKI